MQKFINFFENNIFYRLSVFWAVWLFVIMVSFYLMGLLLLLLVTIYYFQKNESTKYQSKQNYNFY